ncbi:MAG: PTS IIA-like nitrogen regulatory protein PtsN [Gammaproteobacteria bacterium]|nr:PTS IIA-like nitrogen regulatory protein PtsN [Gammaproteobacteria bacterium]
MNFSTILTTERVVSSVAVTSKKKALEELSRLLAKGSAVGDHEIFGSLVAREKLGSTGLGHGVAIPHGRLPAVQNSVGAFVRLKHAVDYDSHDGQPVDLIFGLVVPSNATEEHLKHLAGIAEKFSDEDFCKKARAAKDDKALLDLFAS